MQDGSVPASAPAKTQDLGTELVALSRWLPSPLRAFLYTSISLNVVAFIVLGARRFLLAQTTYPNGYLFLPGPPFYDLLYFLHRFRSFHSTAFFDPGPGPYLYPPAVGPLYEVALLSHHPLFSFFACCAVLLCFFFMWFGVQLRKAGLTSSAAWTFAGFSIACSYVLLFELSRANAEIILSALVIFGLYSLAQGRARTAALTLGIAGAMKIYPLIYLGLLLQSRRYRAFLLGLHVCAAVTIVSLWALCPDVLYSARQVRAGLHQFTGIYALTFEPIVAGVDHSGFGLVKQVLVHNTTPAGHNLFSTASHHAREQKLLALYLLLVGSGLLWTYARRLRHLPLINQAVCFTCAAVFAPPTSFEYTLLHMYAPWVLLTLYTVQDWRLGRRTPPGLTAMFACMALIFSNLAEIQVRGARIEGPLKSVLLVVLFFLAARFPLRNLDSFPPSQAQCLEESA